MVFSSPLFLLFFLPVFLSIYAALRDSWRNGWLLIASLLFYAFGAPDFFWILILSALANFYIVRAMDLSQSWKRPWLLLGIIMNVSLLLIYKYANFAAELWFKLTDKTNTWDSIALPIGISFFTFQSLSYNIDVYRGDHKRLQNPLHYLIYIFSFPQMIAGPIVRYGAVAKELVSRPFTSENVMLGAQRFIIGLVKKVFIANTVAEAFPMVHEGPWTGIGAWSALLAFTLQIYFDFSGYSDMAIGLGRIMGFSFPENFNRPYSATSFTDFWRRWHMTLSFWMRDYLYIGMGGNRKGEARTYLHLLIVFIVSGFWHGASWNFLFWGLFHGLFLVLERACLLRIFEKIPSPISKAWTFIWVMLGWALFAIEDFSEMARFFAALFSPQDIGHWSGSPRATSTLLIGLILILFPVFRQWQKISRFDRVNGGFWIVYLVAGILALAELAGSTFNPFIYFRF